MGRRAEALLLSACRDRWSRLADDAFHLCRFYPPNLFRLFYHQVGVNSFLHRRGSTNNMNLVWLVIGVAVVLFCILLTTTLSNPGIAFRDQPVDPTAHTVSTCRRDPISRMRHSYLRNTPIAWNLPLRALWCLLYACKQLTPLFLQA